jgi:hypothetical protein
MMFPFIFRLNDYLKGSYVQQTWIYSQKGDIKEGYLQKPQGIFGHPKTRLETAPMPRVQHEGKNPGPKKGAHR